MEEFSSPQVCSKCGSSIVPVKYITGGFNVLTMRFNHDYLSCLCGRCEFTWRMKTKDAEKEHLKYRSDPKGKLK